MQNDVRLSAPTLRVLRWLLEKPLREVSGAEISRAVGVSSGTLYPLLARLERVSWLTSNWENVDPSKAGRPRRRFYKLTGLGQARALSALRELQLNSGELVWNS
jgi:PadR family transcriptional regulator, regulatory protein PadR